MSDNRFWTDKTSQRIYEIAAWLIIRVQNTEHHPFRWHHFSCLGQPKLQGIYHLPISYDVGDGPFESRSFHICKRTFVSELIPFDMIMFVGDVSDLLTG